MKRRALPVWCEISCAYCGSFVGGTYSSPKSIAKYRRQAKEDGFIWDKEAREVLCPKCAKKRKEYDEQTAKEET